MGCAVHASQIPRHTPLRHDETELLKFIPPAPVSERSAIPAPFPTMSKSRAPRHQPHGIRRSAGCPRLAFKFPLVGPRARRLPALVPMRKSYPSPIAHVELHYRHGER